MQYRAGELPEKYEAVLFDLDGTLVHTAPEYRYRIVGRTLGKLGVRNFSRHDVDRFWFEGNRDTLVKELFGIESARFWNEYHKHDLIEERKPFMKLYDDVDFIQELRRNGYKTGVVTGAPVHITTFEMGMLGDGKFNSLVMARQESKLPSKPNPHALEFCLGILGVDCRKAMYVGNSDEDVMMAQNARVLDVFLDRGEHMFPDMKPSVKIHSLYELRAPLGI